jgi:hypothetical protein
MPPHRRNFCVAHRRIFRNRVAHGALDPDRRIKALEALSRLVSGLVLALLETWNEAEERDPRRRPSDLLISRHAALNEKFETD